MALSNLRMAEISYQVWHIALTKSIAQFNQKLDTCGSIAEIDMAIKNMILFKEELDYIQESVNYYHEKLSKAQEAEKTKV